MEGEEKPATEALRGNEVVRGGAVGRWRRLTENTEKRMRKQGRPRFFAELDQVRGGGRGNPLQRVGVRSAKGSLQIFRGGEGGDQNRGGELMQQEKKR